MKDRYPDSRKWMIASSASFYIWIGLVFLSIWIPQNNGKVFLTSIAWLIFSILIFYSPGDEKEEKGDNK